MDDHDRHDTPAWPPRLRIGDADRQQMVDVLREHLGAGRLDMAEFERRVEHATNAVHEDDLDGLLDDLPPLDDDQRATAGQDTPRDHRHSGRGPRHGGPARWRVDDGRRRAGWARHGGPPVPLLAVAALLLVAVTHGWILLPVVLLLVASRGGAGVGHWCGRGGPEGHGRRHHRHGRDTRHGRRHAAGPGWRGPGGRAWQAWYEAGDEAWDDTSDDAGRPVRPPSPGRYRPPAPDRPDDAR